MEFTVANDQFIDVDIVDTYKSIIWTDRYNENGDFEICVAMTEKTLDTFQNGFYMKSDISDHVMIIEDLSLQASTENGSFLIITGRSLESILSRRIIWVQTVIPKNTSVDNAIKTLVTDAIINPDIPERAISNFIYEDSTDSNVTSLKLDGDIQFTGDNLYDAVKKICDMFELGFKITLNSSDQFVFKIYSGVDRSYRQEALPYVEFSQNFDNLINSDYKLVTSVYKNVTLVAGEGEGIERKTVSINSDAYSGMQRRELYTDARDLSTKVDDGELTPEQYEEVLINRGLAKLTETGVESNFDAEVDHLQPYIYGRDYDMGDVVQFQNQFGLAYAVRVMESIYSESESGIEQYPTFKILEED